MSDGGADGHAQVLKQATRRLRLATRRLEAAKADRDHAIRKSRDVLSRRRVAVLTEMTPGRIQQIVDRAR